VSFQTAPASERKQRSGGDVDGEFFLGMVSLRYRLWSSTSEVGVSQKSVFST